MIRSITRVIATSTALPSETQASPSKPPITKDTPITDNPMNSEMRAPWIRRDSMSRPRLSVPRTKRIEPPSAHAGAARTASRNCSFGGYGAITSAKIASSTTSTTTARPITAPRFSLNASQNARSGRGGAGPSTAPSGSTAAATASGSRSSCSSMADARVDQAVGQIDGEVDQDHDGGDQHHAALQRGVVAPRDRFDQPLADAGPREDRLGQHRAR